MKKAFIFDVDGTLTPSRQTIDLEFQKFFLEFCNTHPVYLVTGSDRAKTLEQLGPDILAKVTRCYNCSGSEVWDSAGNLIYKDEWMLPEGVTRWLQGQLTSSKFGNAFRAGNHIEQRQGMVNFSVVGRNANNEQRYFYSEFDEATGERERIAKEFNQTFPALQATIGGVTGIDIAPRGNDKSQILRDFDKDTEIHFYGDDMGETGNDYPLAKILVDRENCYCYNIDQWSDTWELLKSYE